MNKFIEKFKKGTQYVHVLSAVNADVDESECLVTDEYLSKKCLKFIPASGAATRMFKDLYAYRDGGVKSESVDKFFENFDCVDNFDDRVRIIDLILDGKLNYGN